MEDKAEVESREELSESYDTGEVLVHKKFFFSSEGMQIRPCIVQKLDAIHWPNHYPVDSAIVCPNIDME